MVAKSQEPYGFRPDFERALVTTASCRPKFYGRTAHALDPELLHAPEAKLVMQAAHAIFADLGRGPDKLMLIDQRLARWRHDGKVSQEQIDAVSEYFEEAIARGLPGEDAVDMEVVPVLQHRMQHDAVKAAIDDLGKRGDYQRTVDLLGKAVRIGVTERGTGIKLGDASFSLIEKLRLLKRLPTGIIELDTYLDGGPPRGTLNVWLTGTGGGKSQAMSHTGAHSTLNGLHTAYATLELPESVVLARVISNMTGIPITLLIENPKAMEEAKRRLAALTGLGVFTVKAFTAKATTPKDIQEWVQELAAAEGRPVDFLALDYADKLVEEGGKQSPQHIAVDNVFEAVRLGAEAGNYVCWTGSQSRGREERKSKKVDLEHTSEGMGKVRVADLVETLNYDEETNEMGFFTAKNRHGRARQMIGPLPCDFALGRIAPVVRSYAGPTGFDATSGTP
jgi:hypothetical protein